MTEGKGLVTTVTLKMVNLFFCNYLQVYVILVTMRVHRIRVIPEIYGQVLSGLVKRAKGNGYYEGKLSGRI